MWFHRFFSVVFTALPVVLTNGSHAMPQIAIAEILITQTEHRTIVSDEIKAMKSGTFAIELVVEKSGASGNAKTKQRNSMNAVAGHAYHNSWIAMTLQEGDRVKATLKLLQNDAILVSKTRALIFRSGALEDENPL
ncbi:hypothetical protein [Cohaesibacter celericrescens]|uniref:hypothetical protein n=1 Tax=Cohaesibacter celericrescens TaxID=2067669 RepID=UPI003565499F